jgi:acyl-CoA thioesterase FadM
MSGDVLTTWGVVLDVGWPGVGEELDAASRCFDAGRAAYFERCPGLAEYLRAEAAALRVTTEQVGPISAPEPEAQLRVGVSVIEVRPTSFEMAVRIRSAGETPVGPVNGRCSVVIERLATGERIAIPREVRAEFIAIQLEARGLA